MTKKNPSTFTPKEWIEGNSILLKDAINGLRSRLDMIEQYVSNIEDATKKLKK